MTLSSAPVANDRAVASMRIRRAAAVTAKTVAGAIVVFAIFAAGALWTERGFFQMQEFGSLKLSSNPLLAHFTRYAVGVLWLIPGAGMLYASAGGFEHGKRWWLILFIIALAWLAAYWLVRGPQFYFYWLQPK